MSSDNPNFHVLNASSAISDFSIFAFNNSSSSNISILLDNGSVVNYFLDSALLKTNFLSEFAAFPHSGGAQIFFAGTVLADLLIFTS